MGIDPYGGCLGAHYSLSFSLTNKRFTEVVALWWKNSSRTFIFMEMPFRLSWVEFCVFVRSLFSALVMFCILFSWAPGRTSKCIGAPVKKKLSWRRAAFNSQSSPLTKGDLPVACCGITVLLYSCENYILWWRKCRVQAGMIILPLSYVGSVFIVNSRTPAVGNGDYIYWVVMNTKSLLRCPFNIRGDYRRSPWRSSRRVSAMKSEYLMLNLLTLMQ